jgi:hypothetical protein
MKPRNIVSAIVTVLIVSFVALYLIALDNRYKQIYGQDYFDIWKRKSQHEIENPDAQPSQ